MEEIVKKVCRTCKQGKLLTEFTKSPKYIDGYTNQCKECRGVLRRQRYANDEEYRKSVLDQGKETRNKNSAIIKQRKKNYYQKNKNEISAKSKEKYYNDHIKSKEKNREFYLKNKDKILERSKFYRSTEKAKEREKIRRRGEKRKQWKRESYHRYKVNPIFKVKRRVYHLKYSTENREALRLKNKLYALNNPDKRKANCHKRRAIKKQAEGYFTAKDVAIIWEKQKGKCVYCRKNLGNTSKDTSKYHVDHIIALAKGGSNWPSNLQCLCPSCNLSKGAKHPTEFAPQFGLLF